MESDGYRSHLANDGREALAALGQVRPDLILLDLTLPDIDGLVLIRQIRYRTTAPIIIITARLAQPDRVLSLREGADDFIAKPFDLDELEARIEAVLRRCRPRPVEVPKELRVDSLVVSPFKVTASMNGVPLQLTRSEFLILEYLAQHPDTLASHEEIASNVLGFPDSHGISHLINVHMSRLKMKMAECQGESPVIHSVRGLGYELRSRKGSSA